MVVLVWLPARLDASVGELLPRRRNLLSVDVAGIGLVPGSTTTMTYQAIAIASVAVPCMACMYHVAHVGGRCPLVGPLSLG